MFESNNIVDDHTTHAGRGFTAENARNHGASMHGTKALGGWHESGSFRSCYDRTKPLDALLGAAGSNARKPEAYFVGRSLLREFNCFLFSLGMCLRLFW